MRRTTALALLLLCALAAAYSADRIRIRSITYDIEGRTRQYFIERLFDTRTGAEFPDRESFEAYLQDRVRILMNERVLESAEILPSYGTPESSNSPDAPETVIPVDLVVKTKDTWNLIGLPYFKYDSNTGLILALRGRDYNFFGTMEPLILNVNWEFDNSGDQTPGVEGRFSYPFRAGGLDWTWNVDTELTAPGWKELDFSFDTGLAVAVPVGGQSISLYASQGVGIGLEKSSGVPYDDEYFLTSTAGMSYSWRALKTVRFGDLVVGPDVSISYHWKPAGLADLSLAQTPELTPRLKASIGRVDWVGNFRRGLSAEADISFPYNVQTKYQYAIVSGGVSGYTAFGPAGPSARLSGFSRLEGSIDNSAGDPVRGVLNNRIRTSSALYLNLDAPVSLIKFRPAEWFGIPWMRYFHFEQQWSPFLDIALVEAEGRLFSPSDAWFGTGLEVITYPAISRSFFVRISAAWDLRDVIALGSLTGVSPRDGRMISEFYLGVGHHY